MSHRSAACQIPLEACGDAGGYTMSLLVREKVFEGAVGGLDMDAHSQEHKQQGIDVKQTTQGPV